jgi:hypothetical protein
MLVTRKSPISGLEVTKDLDVTKEKIDKWLAGGLTQVVFAHLPAADREFIKTGISGEEWDSIFVDSE